MDKLRSLEFFIASIEEGSFANAAKRWGTDPSTVSKAIRRLEQDIQTQLIQRTTRQLKLTPEGETYLQVASSLLSQLGICEAELADRKNAFAGRLKINAPVSYGRLYIRPALKVFALQYPNIQIELTLDDAYIDIIERGFDLCFRTGSLESSGLVGRKLSPMDFITCASSDYIARHAGPYHATTFPDLRWIRFRFKQSGKLMPILHKDNGTVESVDPGEHYVVDDGELMAEMAADGIGVTQVPHFIAKKWLNNGSLLPITPYCQAEQFGVYMVYPKRDFLPQRVRLFIDFFASWLEEQSESPHTTWARQLVPRSSQPSS
jgi:DNA-binding transcriptional LysR family regulator